MFVFGVSRSTGPLARAGQLCRMAGFWLPHHSKRKEGDMKTWSMALAHHALFEMYHLLHTS